MLIAPIIPEREPVTTLHPGFRKKQSQKSPVVPLKYQPNNQIFYLALYQ